jgi:hypothetical protein
VSRILDRVRQLIALASSPEQEEARTAAVLACQLIREHGLVVSEAGAPATSRPPWQHSTEQEATAVAVDVMDAFLRAVGRARANARARGPAPDRDWRRPITAPCHGYCMACSLPIPRATMIYSRPEAGWTHYECGPEALRRPGDIG